jgi:hypothetical protein
MTQLLEKKEHRGSELISLATTDDSYAGEEIEVEENPSPKRSRTWWSRLWR